MIRKQKKLAQLLGIYIDDEAEFVSLYEKQINDGLFLKISLSSLNLINTYLQNFYQNFNCITAKHFLRGSLLKPYLAYDEIYELTFQLNMNSSNGLSYELDFNYPLNLEINLNNIDFWKHVLTQKFVFLKIKRIKSGSIISDCLKKDLLVNNEVLYAQELKQKILRQINMCKNTRLVCHRLELWGYTNIKESELNQILPKLTVNDFGIKDLILLRKVWQEFNLNQTNEQLLTEQDPEVVSYLNKLNKNIIKLESKQYFDFHLNSNYKV